MDDNLKQFTEKLALELKAKFASSEIADFVTKAKASGDDRTFEVVMSTSDEDRQGDSLDQSGWDFKYFDMNPVCLWAHNYQGFPIGIITDITIQGDKAIATGKFAPAGINPEADLACALYQEKILRAVSPGYIQNDDGTRELLEVSFCPVPAGRYALSMRQVRNLGLSTRELITKGFFYKKAPPPKEKAPAVGDHCELDDGTPGVLADDPKSPGEMVCVPERDKSEKTNNNNVDNELTKKLKAEHERHGKAVGKAIDEFGKSESEKAIDEYKDAMESEQGDHLEKCMKAIDDSYESFGREQNEKAIDEFKSEMKAEHLEHVKACDKAIDEFKAEDEPEEKEKAIDEFTKAMGGELERHEKAHMDMCKAEAEKFGEDEEDGKAMKAIVAGIVKSANGKSEFSEAELTDLLLKAGRQISAANKEKIKAVIKAIEDHHTEHGKSTDEVTAALKAIMASGDGGEEPKPDEKSGAAPELKVEHLGSNAALETYLFNQRLARQVKTAAEKVLQQINPKIKELTNRGR